MTPGMERNHGRGSTNSSNSNKTKGRLIELTKLIDKIPYGRYEVHLWYIRRGDALRREPLVLFEFRDEWLLCFLRFLMKLATLRLKATWKATTAKILVKMMALLRAIDASKTMLFLSILYSQR